MPINISILVFVASPLDYARYRHTALYLTFNEPQDPTAIESPKSSLFEVTGSTGFHTFSERVNWEIPISSTGTSDPLPFCGYRKTQTPQIRSN